MPISDLCSKSLASVDRTSTLRQAARLMQKENIGDVVVTDSSNMSKPIGILTDRDIALRCVADNSSLDSKVDDVMSRNVVTISAKSGIAETVQKMSEHAVRRIIVMDDRNQICGVVSSDDILQLIAQEIGQLGNLVKQQTGPTTVAKMSFESNLF